jgi:hypothetical protein
MWGHRFAYIASKGGNALEIIDKSNPTQPNQQNKIKECADRDSNPGLGVGNA